VKYKNLQTDIYYVLFWVRGGYESLDFENWRSARTV